MTPGASAKKPAFFWFVLLAGTIVLGFYVFAGLMIYRHGTAPKDYGWEYDAAGEKYYVSGVKPDGPAAGKLQINDQILAINRDNRVQRAGAGLLGLKRRWLPSGEPYTISVLRGSVEHQFELRMPPTTQDYDKIAGFFYDSLTIAGFFLIGLLVGILKPKQRIAQFYCIVFLTFSAFGVYQVLRPLEEILQERELVVFYIIGLVKPAFLALLYHFFYRFPPEAPHGKFWSFLKYLLYLWAGTLTLANTLFNLVILQGYDRGSVILLEHYDFWRVPSKYLNTEDWIWLLAPVAMSAVLVRNYRLLREPGQRRRIKWLVYSVTLLVLADSIYPVAAILRSSVLNNIYEELIAPFETLLTLTVPIALGYAILKNRLLDIHVVIRQGIQYLLAKNVLRALLVLPIIGLSFTLYSNRNQTLSQILFHNSIYFYLLVAAAFGLKFRTRLGETIDRKFFRESYNQERILLRLIDKIKATDNLAEISKLVSQELDAALHPKRIYLFYREAEKHHLTLGYSSGGALPDIQSYEKALTQTHDSPQIPEEYQLIRIMENKESAQEFPSRGWESLPADEQKWLERLEVELIVPMLGSDQRLVGLLLLGEKKSEEPYSQNDKKLLEALAGQIAVVYENVLLKEKIHKEQKIKREVLAHLGEQNVNLLKECPTCGACYDSSAEHCKKDQTELNLSLPVDRTIEGKYRLEQLIGRGGMGAVYEATDLRLNRMVAIKIMTGSLFGDRTALLRFEREAQASAKLKHPNIMTVYDYGGIGAEGAFLVMEFMDGSTLRAELNRMGKINPITAADWFDQLLKGVRTAHEAGIIHRDLKPENVLLTKDAEGKTLVKILDFGLAKIKLLDVSNPKNLTLPGTVLGTLHYMSPEQLTGQEVDERTDIYSIGVIVVEALTGFRPFPGKTPEELLTAILQRPFHMEGTSHHAQMLDSILQKCLAKNPMGRYASAANLQKDLIPAVRNCAPSSFIDSHTD
jgi:tRNA A-37 threonylcarbamoyl transferase component Bud32/GAF domain-containing protein